MKSYKTIGTALVKVEYRRGFSRDCGKHGTIITLSDSDGDFSIAFNYDDSFVPTEDCARDAILAFDDVNQEGLVGKGCPCRMVVEEPDHWVFEVLANRQRSLWDCQCCAYSFADGDGIRKSTGLGKTPYVTQFADAPGWGVVCSDCGMDADGSTMDEAISAWNEQNERNKVPEKINVKKEITRKYDDIIPF